MVCRYPESPTVTDRVTYPLFGQRILQSLLRWWKLPDLVVKLGVGKTCECSSCGQSLTGSAITPLYIYLISRKPLAGSMTPSERVTRGKLNYQGGAPDDTLEVALSCFEDGQGLTGDGSRA